MGMRTIIAFAVICAIIGFANFPEGREAFNKWAGFILIQSIALDWIYAIRINFDNSKTE